MNYINHPEPYKYPDKDQWQKQQIPKPATIFDVFPRLDRWGIGLDSFFEELNSVSKLANSASYPPCNIIKFGDDAWEIQMAVAGFKKDQLEISVKDRTLTIKSVTLNSSKKRDETIIHRGIAEREFTQTFALSEYVEITDASLEDGMLCVKLELQLPEEKKPKVIDIK
jgi:molecular chaperone IbpA